MNYWTQSPQHIYVAGHRGWRSRFPENTLESFRAAVELGVDQIETDVRVTKDGQLVLIHDARVDRTTDGRGEVRQFTLEELKRLDAGSFLDPKFAGARIPTLRELFELVRDHPTLTLDLELKEYPSREPGWEETAFDVCRRTVDMAEEYGFGDRIVLNTFSEQLMDYIYGTYGRKYRTHVFYPRTLMADRGGDPYRMAYCACVGPGRDLEEGRLTAEEIRAFFRDRGIQPWAGAYVRDEAGVDLAVEMGATLITADDPQKILSILRRRGLHP